MGLFRLLIGLFTLFYFFQAFGNQEKVLSMSLCVELAKMHSADVEIADIKTERAVAEKNEVRSFLLPHILLNGVWDNSNRTLAGSLTQFQDFRSTHAVGLNAQVGVWDFGASWKRLKASKLRIDVAEFERDAVEFAIENEVKTLYLEILEKEKLIELLCASKERLKSQLDKSCRFFDQGLLRNADVLAVKVQLAEKEKALLQTQNEALSLRMSLNRLIGFPLCAPVTLVDVAENPFCVSTDGAYEHALTYRPDLLALQAQLEALRLEKKALYVSWAPRFYIFANGNSSSDETSFSGGLGMNMALYEGGAQNAQVKKVNTEIREVQVIIEEASSQLFAEIENTARNFDEIYASLELDKTSIAYAEEEYADMVRFYEEGVDSVYETLLAEEQLFLAKLSYISNLYRFHKELAHFTKITAGFCE